MTVDQLLVRDRVKQQTPATKHPSNVLCLASLQADGSVQVTMTISDFLIQFGAPGECIRTVDIL
jgi:hypothetical protein